MSAEHTAFHKDINSTGSSSLAGNVTQSFPLTAIAGDVLMLYVFSLGLTVATPAGWNVVAGSPVDGTGIKLSLFWHRVTTSEGYPASSSVTVTNPGGWISVNIGVVANCVETGDPFLAGTGSAGTGSSINFAGAVDSTEEQAVIMYAAVHGYNASSNQFSSFSAPDLPFVFESVDAGRFDGTFPPTSTMITEFAGYGVTPEDGAWAAPTVTCAVTGRPWVAWTGILAGAETPVPQPVTLSGPWRSTGSLQVPFYGNFAGPGWYPPLREHDIAVMGIESLAETLNISSPAGWAHAPGSPVVNNTGPNPTQLSVLWKRIGADEWAETYPTIDAPTDHVIAGIVSFRNCKRTGSPWDADTETATGSGTGVSIGGVTTTEDNCEIVTIFGTTRSSLNPFTFGNPSNSTLIRRVMSLLRGGSNQGAGGGFGSLVGFLETAGSSGTTSTTAAVAEQWTAWTGALLPYVEEEPLPAITVTPPETTLTELEPVVLTSDVEDCDWEVTSGAGTITEIGGATGPDEIASLWAYYEADSYALSDGATVATAWQDKSPNNRDMTVTGAPVFETNELNGEPAVRLPGAACFNLPSMDALTAGHYYLVLKLDSLATSGGNDFGDSASVSHYPHSTGPIYDTFGQDERENTITSLVTLTNYHVVHGHSAPDDWALLQNGATARANTTDNTVNFPAAPRLGFNGAQYMQARICGLYLFSAKLDAADDAAMRAYLQDRYGVTIAGAAPGGAVTQVSFLADSTDETCVVTASKVGYLPDSASIMFDVDEPVPAITVTPATTTLSAIEAVVLTADVADCTWTVTSGSGALTVLNSTQVSFLPATMVTSHVVTASKVGYTSDSASIGFGGTVTGSFEFVPNFASTEGATRVPVRFTKMEDGTRFYRRRGPAVREYNLAFNERTTEEALAVLAFWTAFRTFEAGGMIEKYFSWTDPFLGQTRNFYIDSDLTMQPDSMESVSYRLTFRERIVPDTSREEMSNVFPFAPDYGYEMNFERNVITSDSLDWQRVSRLNAGGNRELRYGLAFKGREPEELIAMEAFFLSHYPGKVVSFPEPVLFGETEVFGDFYIDSDLEWNFSEHNLCDYRLVLVSVVTPFHE